MSNNEALRKLHPEYTTMSPKWKFWEDSVVGGQRFQKGGYLIPHPRESKINRQAFLHRSQFATYDALGKDVADDWNARLFGPGATVALVDHGSVADEYQSFAKDVSDNIDLLGTDLKTFFNQLSFDALTMGSYGCVVDVIGSQSEDPPTLLQAEQSGVRPYLRSIPPQNILDWSHDVHGNYEWVKIREPYDIPRGWDDDAQELSIYPGFDSDSSTYRYHILDKEGVTTYTPDGKDSFVKNYSVHNLGVVPFALISWVNTRPGEMFAQTMLEEIYHFSCLIYQLRSGLIELAESQMFALFIIATLLGESDISGIDPASSRALAVSGAAGFPPFYASPDSSLPEAHLKVIASMEAVVKRKSKGVGMTMVDNKVTAASGRSHAFSTDPLTNLLRDCGHRLEPQFLSIVKMIHSRSTFAGSEFSGKVKFPDTHVLRGTIETVDEVRAVMDVMRPFETATRVQFKKLVAALFPGVATSAELNQIYDEIQDTPLEDMFYQDDSTESVGDEDDQLERRLKSSDRGRTNQEQSGPDLRRSRERG